MNANGRPTNILTAEEKRALAKQLLREKNHISSAAGGRPLEAISRARAAVPAEFASFDHHPHYLNLQARAAAGHAYYHVHEGCAGDQTVIDRQLYLNFANYNYLGLSGDPRIAAAVTEAVTRYGSSVSASRMVGGERPIHRALETSLAEILDTEDCLSFVSGHATNVTTLGHLFGPNDLILHDALIHNSVVMGAMLSGARRIAFRHNDWQAVDEILTRLRGDFERVVIVVEGIYSMDGDFPDLPRFIELKRRHKSFLMVDEAHSLGVMGPRGFGIHEHFGIAGSDVDIWMGTLSKSLASCGGYVAGSKSLILTLRYSAPSFVFSVGLTPANAAAALTALDIMKLEPDRVKRLNDRAAYFARRARDRYLPVGKTAGLAIVPLIVGDTPKCLALSKALFERHINVQPIIYPAVDERSARLRFFINCTHTEQQIDDAVQVIEEEWHRIGDPS